MMRDLLLACLLVFIAAASATAQTTLHYREGQRVDPDEVQRILQNGDAGAPRTRSIRLLPDAPGTTEAITAAPGPAPTPSALSLPVQFEFDSATLQPAAREQLDALAAGIKRLPAGRRVVVEGHTDAVGSDDYNRALSLRRAAAVKQYLVQEHGIEARRLQEAGAGKRRPIEGSDPYAGENRRVEFRGA